MNTYRYKSIDWSYHNIHTLKEELRRIGCARSGNKATLVARMVVAQRWQFFPAFPKFPPEIRQMIFAAALPARRVITLGFDHREDHKYSMNANFLYRTAFSNPQAYYIMLSCKEGQDVVMRRYKLQREDIHIWTSMGGVLPVRIPEDLQSTSKLISFHDDVFYLRHDRLDFSLFDEALSAITGDVAFNGTRYRVVNEPRIRTLYFEWKQFQHLCEGAKHSDANLILLLKLKDLKEIIVKEKDPDHEEDRREYVADQWGITMIRPNGRPGSSLFWPKWLHDYSDVPSTEVCQKLKRTWEKRAANHPGFRKIKLLFAKNSWRGNYYK